MSEGTAKNVFEEWMLPFIDKEEPVASQLNEDQLDLFADQTIQASSTS
ncbi:MAG TPA: hypothetical protein PLU46_05440 [Thiotrichales bacterium]|jgi:hypothetical protein|nr:hypothetical protein [Thiotrichales bacterium]HQT04417.1 hypothetical protein [Thiotrichales bacterium]